MENPRSRSDYAKKIATRKQVMKRFGPYLIKADLWFHIFKLVPQRKISPPSIFVNIYRILSEKSGKNMYLCNMTRKKIVAFFWALY